MKQQQSLPRVGPSFGNRAYLYGGGVVFLLLVIVTAIVALMHLHEQVRVRTEVATRTLASSITQTLDGLLDTIDVAFVASSKEISRQMLTGKVDAPSITRMLIEQRKHIPVVAHFRATDEHGDIIYGPDIPVPPVNTSDREHFITLRDHPEAGLVTDKPFLGRISKQWVWTFARRINKPDGSFGGVTFAAVFVDKIGQMLGKIQMERGGSISLRNASDQLIARYPLGENVDFPVGEQRFSAEWLVALNANPSEGTYVSQASRSDGVARTYSYQRSDKYGFMVNVGISHDTAFAAWRKLVWVVSSLVVILIAALSALMALISRAWRRQEDALISLQEAQQIAHVGQYRHDLHTGRWHSSEIFDDMFGIGADYARTPQQWLQLFAPEVHAEIQVRFDAARSGHAPAEREFRIIRQNDGEERWVHCRSKLQFGPNGTPSSLVGTVQDITESKRAEADLRVAAFAFDSQEGMIITDTSGVILRANRAFAETTGYTIDELVGKTPSILKSGRHDADFYRDMWQSIRDTGGWQGEIWDRRKNGEIYPKWLIISTVVDDEGNATHYIGAQVDITERKQAEEKINELAFYDQLTGLPNRTLLHDRIRQAMAASERSGACSALLLIDLDNFKTLNDTLGHDMGDLLLQQVALRLQSVVRSEDTVARLGGDEFVVMLSGLGADEKEASMQTELIGKKILAALNESYRLGRIAYHSTPSIGASLFCGQKIELDVLLKQADLAMYRSKDAGRNTLRFFNPEMEAIVLRRAALENDLRLALQERQFVVYYQAQVANGVLTGAEALVRWRHPQRGLVPPIEFIPVAEDTGLIQYIGNFVLEEACRQLVLWRAQPGMAHLTIAVNVSAHQFHQSDFVAQVLAAIERTGADPGRLKLELTESMLVTNVEDLIEKMFVLKTSGVGFALDDFGTGYSSLSFLKRLPLDQLKIDQSFVRDVLTDPNDASIARTIITLADSLGMGVIAEGVETAMQRDFLANAGCNAYQGYFFSRPLPVAEFEQYVRQFA
ncbi:MAG: hypothetical protein H6R04_515 [Burkholderiaceae bacterium]|nr:hypothetical protein [Burkholderiaceae bacterium]